MIKMVPGKRKKNRINNRPRNFSVKSDCCIPPLFFVWRYKFNGIVKSPKFSVKLSSEKINPVGRVSVNNDLDHDTAGYVRPRVEFS